MTRSRCALLLVLAACGGTKSEPPPAADPPDPEVEAFVTDYMTYGDKSVLIVAKFSGDCGAVAGELLTLEPLAQKIRDRRSALDADREKSITLRQRITQLKPQVVEHYGELLKPLGMTMADIGKKESEMKARCASDPKWRDAQDRVGLTRKPS